MWWASTEQVMGTYCPYCGHRVPILWDDFWALFWVSEFVFFLYVVDYNFCVFVQCFMVIWWYFYRNYDTSMILLCKHIWKCHFANHYVSVIYLQTMILWDFFQEKKHLCARIKNGWICVICKRLLTSFSWKIQKVRKKLLKVCQSHFFLLYLHP